MDWTAGLRDYATLSDSSGPELVRAYLRGAHNSPGLPPQAYDGDDPMPLMLRLGDDVRRELGLPILDGARASAVPRGAPSTPQSQPVLQLRVHLLCASDDDGSNSYADPATAAQWITAGLNEANAIYAARGAGVEFVFDPGDVSTVADTMINQDFTVPAGTDLKTGPNTKPLSDSQITDLGTPHEQARNKYCQQWPDRVVFLICCGTQLDYDPATKVWVVHPRSGFAYSWEDKEFVNFPAVWGALHGPEIAHESGHFLHLWHTHSYAPATVADAVVDVKDFVGAGNADPAHGDLAFDGDRGSGVTDTPPDPGPQFYAAVSGEGDPGACDLAVYPHLSVDFGDSGRQTYAFDTDRGDVMSYFKDCTTTTQHVTAGQIARMRGALLDGNRRRIVATQLGDTATPTLRYSALWNAGNDGCVWYPRCTESELRAKVGELWPAMRLRQMTGFVLKGEIYYSAIWEPGGYGQVWWPNCSDAEFRDKTAELWATARPAQVHAFVVTGEIRYSCLWNTGVTPQVWWENCSEQEFRDKTGELWATMRPVQAQAFAVNNDVRYSALWNAGTQPVVWWPNCTEQQFRDKTAELWPSMRPSAVNAVRTADGMHFSALWTPSTIAQSWWPLCTEEQLRQKTGDLWSSHRPASWMPVSW
jgi:hypothetical protein